jgi:uncharacterized membrane protein YgdD (TMEM256/DUF423 family)
MNRSFVAIGAWAAMVGVALGAFGTHSLRGKISLENLEVWRTAVQYHLIHALALIGVGLAAAHSDSKLLRTSGWMFLVGIVIFGGSLYALALTDLRYLGAITPLGGLCFLIGWATFAVGVSRPA